MIAKSKTPKINYTHTPENQGVTYEEIRLIAQRSHNSQPIGDNDTM